MNVLTRTASTLLIVGVTLTGCGVGEAVEETVAQVSAATTLAEGVPTTESPVFRYTIKGGQQPLSGVVDGPHKALTTEAQEKIPDSDITLSMKFLIVGDEAWTKIAFKNAGADSGLPKLPKKWMKLDQKKLAADSGEDFTYQGESDPGYVSDLLRAAADLKETGKGVYAGTTDLTGSTEAEIVDADTLAALGEQAKTVPLELTLDAEGRITRALVKIPAAGKAKAATYEVVYDQYGTVAPVTAPTDGVAAPADVYEMLKG
ncbi:hypothetical protein GCM10010112_31730 [Actinoplanes lobatus]|uniref:Lipoprotein n=1 Tax=Actinoplanes lobatus TaxID=113568 RepID=A0A7W7HE66_9ACTN|nr:hypothetical protein [Actinoplanes lobatus]MBB4748887.1 hypothetical protein [Actinoplanes lobatus]GGN67894.1 hypothetical protein GCM10010112_31730 [Actinoplanes lobatus]GIE37205.1 hypothetical protein Alo02nite_01030 [Actinoplanes lobatus]